MLLYLFSSTRNLGSLFASLANFGLKCGFLSIYIWSKVKIDSTVRGVISYRSRFVVTTHEISTCAIGIEDRSRHFHRFRLDYGAAAIAGTRRGIISRCRLEIAIMVTSTRLEPYSCIRLVLPLFTHMLIPTGACSWTSGCFVKR